MYNSIMIENIIRERQNDLIKEAQTLQMIREIKDQTPSPLRHSLALMGEMLVKLGNKLTSLENPHICQKPLSC